MTSPVNPRRSSSIALCPTIMPLPGVSLRVARGPARNARRDDRSEQPDDLAVRVDVDVLAPRARGQARHGPHLARQWGHEAGPGRESDLPDRDAEAGRTVLQRGVVAQRVLALGHADWQAPEPERL